MSDQQPEALRLADALATVSYTCDDTVKAAAELRRLHRVELARNEWITKTEWVQQAAHPRELGMHRADVMRKRIERLQAENEQLRSALAEATLQHDTAQSTEADPTVGASRLRGVNMREQNTHAQGCWDWGPKHYECAVGQVKRNEALLRQAMNALINQRGEPDFQNAMERESVIAALRERLGEQK